MSYLPALKPIDRPRALLMGFICLMPFIVLISLPLIFFQTPVTNWVPNGWNDQVSNWRQITTMHTIGWDGGYYTLDERPAAAQFSHYYAHGPMFPLLYGTISRITGWGYATGLWFNAVFLSMGLAFFMLSARLDTKQCFYLGLLYGTYWILHLYTVSLMQEAFHHAGALVFAGIFARLMRREGPLSAVEISLITLFTVFMGLMRVSWMLLSLPLFLFMIPPWRIKWIIGAFAAAGVLTGAVYLVGGWLASPGANSVTSIVSLLLSDPTAGLAALNNFIGGNTKSILQNIGYSLQGLQTIQILILFGIAFFYLVRRARTQSGDKTAYWLFVLYALLSIVVLSCILYLSSGFLRIFALPLFICVCLLIVFREYKILALILALNIIGIGPFRNEFVYHGIAFQYAADEMSEWQAEVDSILVYQEDAPSPWCNTVLIDLILYDFRVAMFPPEMGIGWYSFGTFPTPMKSRYYLATDPVDKPFLQELTTFSFGSVLYENTGVRAQCLGPDASSG